MVAPKAASTRANVSLLVERVGLRETVLTAMLGGNGRPGGIVFSGAHRAGDARRSGHQPDAVLRWPVPRRRTTRARSAAVAQRNSTHRRHRRPTGPRTPVRGVGTRP